ncbi:MAG: methylated-DNA--[protein]-cysteine S-methyltransferase, partial [Proteobacteria bacterium]|nr:methylated-DNA--[protein]-cysteine S-methyltransferase [Pseudomonadota bacterium]
MEPIFTFMETPIGILELKADSQHLLGIRLRGDPQNGKGSKNQGINKVLSLAREELERYFSQNLTRFTVPVKPVGTPFQEQAWKALLQIPYGETRSYAEQACMAGAGLATRAIGSANGANPIPIIIPCHRV